AAGGRLRRGAGAAPGPGRAGLQDDPGGLRAAAGRPGADDVAVPPRPVVRPVARPRPAGGRLRPERPAAVRLRAREPDHRRGREVRPPTGIVPPDPDLARAAPPGQGDL